jgi:dolichol-phosphate mannosyltransferase
MMNPLSPRWGEGPQVIDRYRRYMPDPQITLIVPTLDEAANLPALAERINKALAGRSYELRIVDDNSRDNTKEVCAELAVKYPLILMTREQPKNGLGGAVLHGMQAARGEFLVVMDADLQHPPEKLPELLAPLESNAAEFVIGSRYVPGGSTQEQWTLYRMINSRVATLLARPFAGDTRDPMSGFFALRRGTFERAEHLTPLGYKIGLELMCKCRVQKVQEIPIDFGTRQHGESKLSLKEQFRYLEHLSRLYDFTFPRLSPIVKFLIVVAIGWFVGLGVFAAGWALPLNPMLAAVFGYVAVLQVTAVFHTRYVRTQREFIIGAPWRSFLLIAAGELLAVVLVAWWLQARLPYYRAVEFWTISFAGGLIVRYVLRKEMLQDIRGLRKDARVREHST